MTQDKMDTTGLEPGAEVEYDRWGLPDPGGTQCDRCGGCIFFGPSIDVNVAVTTWDDGEPVKTGDEPDREHLEDDYLSLCEGCWNLGIREQWNEFVRNVRSGK